MSRQSTKGQKFPIEILTPSEVRALIRAPSRRAPTGIRNRAMLVLIYRGALRIGETLNLLPKDLNRDTGAVRILHGKGDIARTVSMDPMAVAVVDQWMSTRAQLEFNGRHRLICTLEGQPVRDNYVRAMVKRMARRAGIEKRVHCHALRHTASVELLNEGADVALISQVLGHKSIETTVRYIDHVCPKRVIDTMRARAWTL